jgi:RNA polymerase sigma-70 factor (ECF subfamily)
VTADEQNRLFTDWIAQHGSILHHVARGFAQGADRHDLVQELMLAVWRAAPSFRGGAQVSTFLFRVAHNAALTWHRTQRNYRHRVDRFGEMPPAVPDGDSSRHEALEHIYAAIRLLPPVDRSIILLHLDGVAYAEIAAIHGLTEGNVGARLSRLKQKLTTALEGITHELR